jgi:hypothetical protein
MSKSIKSSPIEINIHVEFEVQQYFPANLMLSAPPTTISPGISI